MATSITYTANGTNDTFNIPFAYIERSHVIVSVNGVVQLASAYTFPAISSIKLNVVPAAGIPVEIRRSTPAYPITEYQQGGVLTKNELETDSKQPLFLIEEFAENKTDEARVIELIDQAGGAGLGAGLLREDLLSTLGNKGASLVMTTNGQTVQQRLDSTGLGYTPVNKAGDTMTGQLILNHAGQDKILLRGAGSGFNITMDATNLSIFDVAYGNVGVAYNTTTGAFTIRGQQVWHSGNFNPANYQGFLGYTPVQQGGGAGQGTNKVYMGWSGTGLKVQVDALDLGHVIFESSHTWNALSGKPATFTPSAHNHDGGAITTGTVAAARLGGGTPSASVVLKGNSSWGPVAYGEITGLPALGSIASKNQTVSTGTPTGTPADGDTWLQYTP